MVISGGFVKTTSTTGKLSVTPKPPSGSVGGGGRPVQPPQSVYAPEPYFVEGRWIQPEALRSLYNIPVGQSFEVKQGQVYIPGTRALTAEEITEEIRMQEATAQKVAEARAGAEERKRLGIAGQASYQQVAAQMGFSVGEQYAQQFVEKKLTPQISQRELTGRVEITRPSIVTKEGAEHYKQQAEIKQKVEALPSFLSKSIWRAQEGFGFRGVSDFLKGIYPTREQYAWATEEPTYVRKEALKQTLQEAVYPLPEYTKSIFAKQEKEKRKEEEIYGKNVELFTLPNQKKFIIPIVKVSKFLEKKVFTGTPSEEDWVGKTLKYRGGEVLYTAGVTYGLSTIYTGLKYAPYFITSQKALKVAEFGEKTMRYGFYGAGAVWAGTTGIKFGLASEKERKKIAGETLVDVGAMYAGAWVGSKTVSKGYETFLAPEIKSLTFTISGIRKEAKLIEPLGLEIKPKMIKYYLYNELNIQLTKKPTVLFGEVSGKSRGQTYKQVSVIVGENVYTTTKIGSVVSVSKTLPTGKVTGRTSLATFPIYQPQFFNKLISRIPIVKEISLGLVQPLKPLEKMPLSYKLGFGREYTKFKDISKTIPLTKEGELKVNIDLITKYAEEGIPGKNYAEWSQEFLQGFKGEKITEGLFKVKTEKVGVSVGLKAKGFKKATQKQIMEETIYPTGERVSNVKYITPKFVKHPVNIQRHILELTGSEEDIALLRKQQLDVFKNLPFGGKPLIYKNVLEGFEEGKVGYKREIQSIAQGTLGITPKLKIKVGGVEERWKTPAEFLKIDLLKQKFDIFKKILKEKVEERAKVKKTEAGRWWELEELRLKYPKKYGRILETMQGKKGLGKQEFLDTLGFMKYLEKKFVSKKIIKEKPVEGTPTRLSVDFLQKLREQGKFEKLQEQYPLIEPEQIYSGGRQQLVLEQPEIAKPEPVKIFKPTIIGTGIQKDLAKQIINMQKIPSVYTQPKILQEVKPRLSFLTKLKTETMLKPKTMIELIGETKTTTELANRLRTETKTETKLRTLTETKLATELANRLRTETKTETRLKSLTELKTLTKLDTRLRLETRLKTRVTTPPEIPRFFIPKAGIPFPFGGKQKKGGFIFPKFKKYKKPSERFYPFADPLSLLRTELRTMKRATHPRITERAIKKYRGALGGGRWFIPTVEMRKWK